jgi:hypothetical protein
MNHKWELRSVVTRATSVAFAVFILVWCALALIGVKVPAWAMWTVGGVIGKYLLFAVVLLTIWPARKVNDDQEAVKVEEKFFNPSGINGESPESARTSIKNCGRWRWRSR